MPAAGMNLSRGIFFFSPSSMQISRGAYSTRWEKGGGKALAKAEVSSSPSDENNFPVGANKTARAPSRHPCAWISVKRDEGEIGDPSLYRGANDVESSDQRSLSV